MKNVAIVHNIPIHYKHLLFSSLTNHHLDLMVLFMAVRSKRAVAFDLAAAPEQPYAYRIGYNGWYEQAPALARAAFVWKNLTNLLPAVVIISGYYAIECWIAMLWAKCHKAQVVLWYESNEFDKPRTWPKETLKRLFLLGCNQAHVYGTTNADYLQKLGLPSSLILHKRAVVNADLFLTAKEGRTYRKSGVVRLLYVGRLSPEKNLDLLLQAFSNVRARQPHPSMRLVLAGSGALEGELKQKCAELGIDNDVDFLGHHSQAALPDVFRSCDVFVLPSLSETWGLVVNEAMLCRMPVIVSRQCGCAADLVTPETGWCFSPWQPAELETAIQQAVTCSSEKLAAMGDAGFDLSIEYSPEKCANRVIEGLSTLAAT